MERLPDLSIVVPAYNEASRLPATLPQMVAFCERRAAELLIVDDGSTDGTVDLVQKTAATTNVLLLLRNPGNRGKGFSIRHGMQKAAGEWILFSDADLSTPLEEYDKLIEAARRQGAVIAVGSRALDRSLVGVHQGPAREFAGRVFNLVMRLATGLPFRDTQCGFKLYHRDAARVVFERQTLTGFGFDVEDLMIAKIHKLRAVEVPVRWNNVEGTKVGGMSGARAFWDLALVRWNQLRGLYR